MGNKWFDVEKQKRIVNGFFTDKSIMAQSHFPSIKRLLPFKFFLTKKIV